MLEDSSRFGRLKRDARRLAAHLRPRHLAMVTAVVAVAVALAGLRGMAPAVPRPVVDGERLRIQVVAPVEPPVGAGSVMDVGDLIDGFEYRPPPPPVIDQAGDGPWDEDFAGSRPTSAPAPNRYREEAVIHAPPQPEEPERDWRDGRVGRWFGFDAPERDYRSEREARRARREDRPGRDGEPRAVRRYHADGTPADQD